MSETARGRGVDFDSVEAGDDLPTTGIDLGHDFVRDYACAIGMPFARFTDDEGARREGLPGQITPGNLSLALLARVLLAWAPGARLLRLGTTFRGLIPAGSSVHVIGAVTEKDESGRTVECDVWMESEEGDRVVVGTATVALP